MKLITDTDLLDFLEEMGDLSGLPWTARPSHHGRGWRLHQDHTGEHDRARDALRAAMDEYVPNLELSRGGTDHD